MFSAFLIFGPCRPFCKEPLLGLSFFARWPIFKKLSCFSNVWCFFERFCALSSSWTLFFPSLSLGFETGLLKRRVQDKSHAHAQNGAIFVPQIGGKIISWTLLLAPPGSAPIYGAGKKGEFRNWTSVIRVSRNVCLTTPPPPSRSPAPSYFSPEIRDEVQSKVRLTDLHTLPL